MFEWKFEYNCVFSKIVEPKSIAQKWSTLMTGIDTWLCLSALMLTHIKHSGNNLDFH